MDPVRDNEMLPILRDDFPKTLHRLAVQSGHLICDTAMSELRINFSAYDEVEVERRGGLGEEAPMTSQALVISFC